MNPQNVIACNLSKNKAAPVFHHLKVRIILVDDTDIVPRHFFDVLTQMFALASVKKPQFAMIADRLQLQRKER